MLPRPIVEPMSGHEEVKLAPPCSRAGLLPEFEDMSYLSFMPIGTR